MGMFFKNQGKEIEDELNNSLNKSAESVHKVLNDKWLLSTDGSKTSLEPPLTNRDKIAINAMKKLIETRQHFSSDEGLAERSYKIADAMLKQREL